VREVVIAWNQVIETAREVTGKNTCAWAKDEQEILAVLIASSEKIRRELGWKAEFQGSARDYRICMALDAVTSKCYSKQSS
jgi:UDP-glucose 4-epimerase